MSYCGSPSILHCADNKPGPFRDNALQWPIGQGDQSREVPRDHKPPLSCSALQTTAGQRISFDFKVIAPLNKALTMELARCAFVDRRENVIALGPSGTGKTHVALGLGLMACQKGLKVRLQSSTRYAKPKPSSRAKSVQSATQSIT